MRTKPKKKTASLMSSKVESPIVPFHLDYFQETVFHIAGDHFENSNIASDLVTFVSLANESSLKLAKKYRAFVRSKKSRRKRKRETIEEVFVFNYTRSHKESTDTDTQLCASFSVAVNALYDSLIDEKFEGSWEEVEEYVLGKEGQEGGWGYAPDWVDYKVLPGSILLAEYGDASERNIWEIKRGNVRFA